MAALYIPRGYISTQQAVDRLIEARQRQPQKLSASQRTLRGLESAAVCDIRSALAEGDIPANLVTNKGDQHPIHASRWRASDGLSAVQSGRVDIQLPFRIGRTKGQGLIKEIDFIAWLSTIAPKPFSHVSVSPLVKKPAPHVARPPVSTPTLKQPAETNEPTATAAMQLVRVDSAPAASQKTRPSKRPKSPRDQLTDALIQIHHGGINIIDRNRDELHKLALQKAGFGKSSRGISRSTFERALDAAREKV